MKQLGGTAEIGSRNWEDLTNRNSGIMGIYIYIYRYSWDINGILMDYLMILGFGLGSCTKKIMNNSNDTQ